jgi:hypothetical protein
MAVAPGSDPGPRRGVFGRESLLAIVAGVCMINGIFSPWVAIALQIAPVLMPEMFPRSVGWALFFSSISVATATLVLSGIPAALYERFAAPDEASTVSMWLWLTVATLMSLPALENIDRLM